MINQSSRERALVFLFKRARFYPHADVDSYLHVLYIKSPKPHMLECCNQYNKAHMH